MSSRAAVQTVKRQQISTPCRSTWKRQKVLHVTIPARGKKATGCGTRLLDGAGADATVPCDTSTLSSVSLGADLIAMLSPLYSDQQGEGDLSQVTCMH